MCNIDSELPEDLWPTSRVPQLTKALYIVPDKQPQCPDVTAS